MDFYMDIAVLLIENNVVFSEISSSTNSYCIKVKYIREKLMKSPPLTSRKLGYFHGLGNPGKSQLMGGGI